MSVPEMWNRLFLENINGLFRIQTAADTHQSTQETYSPVGRRNRLMRESGVQSTGAEMRKYLTSLSQPIGQLVCFRRRLRLSTCCNATCAS